MYRPLTLAACCTTPSPPPQVLRVHASSRLLLVAPSNSAADLLALRVLDAGRPSSELLRVHAYQRPREDVDPKLQEKAVCTWSDGDGAFLLPEAAAVMAKRVVVVTCLMAAKVGAWCGEGHLSLPIWMCLYV